MYQLLHICEALRTSSVSGWCAYFETFTLYKCNIKRTLKEKKQYAHTSATRTNSGFCLVFLSRRGPQYFAGKCIV